MIIERNEFRLKFGKAKEGIELWNKMIDILKDVKDAPKIRMLVDLTGSSYTLIIELHLRDLMQIGFKNYQWMTTAGVHELYAEFLPICESSVRTLYRIERET